MNYWGVIFKNILFFAVLVFIYKKIDFEIFWSHFDLGILRGIIFAQIPIIISVFIVTHRYLFLLDSSSLKFRHVFNSMILSFGLNNVLPGRSSEFIKATYLKKKSNIPLVTSIGVIFVERFIDLIVLILVGVVAFFFTIKKLHIDIYIPVLISVVFIIAFIFFYNPLVKVAGWFEFGNVRNILRKILNEIKNRLTWEVFIKGVMLGFLYWGSLIVSALIFFFCAGADNLDYQVVTVIYIVATFGGAIAILPGGLGTFEAAVVLVLKNYGYDFDEALVFAVGLRMVNLLILLPWSLFIALSQGIGIRHIMRKARIEQSNYNRKTISSIK